jgi:hypothetical protein
MKKRWLSVLLAALAVACLLAPSTALAKTKIKPHIRGVSTRYVMTVATPSADILGRIVYRKNVRKGGKWVKIDAPIRGSISLYNFSTGESISAKISNAGYFSFHVTRAGAYRIRYAGTKSIASASAFAAIYNDVVKIANLRALSASHEASGGVFVKVAADIQAPAGCITTSTPIVLVFWATDGPDVGLFDPSEFVADYLQLLHTPGSCSFGFSVPADTQDKSFTLHCETEGLGAWLVSASAEITFTPSDYLP